jgi:dihydroorotate dehydrogenase
MILEYLPPELTYRLGGVLLSKIPLPRVGLTIPTGLGDLTLTNPLGLGAGLDKDAVLIRNIARMGLGFITLGSVTLKPRVGNPRPRFVRYPGLGAMVNAVGLPSIGLRAFMGRLGEACSSAHKYGTALFVSIAGFSLGEFTSMIDSLSRSCADALELNVSSPTYGGSWVRSEDSLVELMAYSGNAKRLVMLKLPLGAPVDWYKTVVRLADRYGLGLTIANTLPVKEPRLSVGYGGLSGPLIYPITRLLITKARGWGFRGPVIGIGGITSGRQVVELLREGANAVGIVTTFTIEGPWGIMRVTREVADALGAGKHY